MSKLRDTWFKDLVENLDEGVYFVDRNRLITFWSGGSERLTGYTRDDVMGHHCFTNILRHIDEDGKELCHDGCPLHATIKDGQTREADVYLHHKDGHRVPITVRAMPILDGEGGIIGAMEVFVNRTEQLAALQRIRSLEQAALVDGLTGLANRRYTEIATEGRLSEYARYAWSFGLLFADIDHFKQINDAHGHDVGDRVLRAVARTMAGGLRNHDFIGRWGGEEFVVLLTRIRSEDELRLAAERLQVLAGKTGTQLETGSVSATISIGATMVREGDTLESIVNRADGLMYQSKSQGRDRVTVG